FALEVPEIADGSVEISAIARARPTAPPRPRQEGGQLAATVFSDELHLIDTCMAAPEEAAARARARFVSGAQHPHWHRGDEDEEPEDQDEQDEEVLTPRTAAVLAWAGEELSAQAWQEVTALGDEPLPPGADGVFGRLPAITRRRDGQWRRQMARAFDDLTGDLRNTPVGVEPTCTGEEMALHLMISHARSITGNRPRALHDRVAHLPQRSADHDWERCSDPLFEDHDVLMFFDAQLDGVDDLEGEIHQTLGLVNLAADEWFEPFRADGARDPHRASRH
ncbi:hypothetical protein, partial [Streptomyces sp. NPDC046939]|uniref:hypothetical protein n=1 Tax=Streptomyces sp. NPDC046939 TaxID=3155376 RepID=UPI00340AFFCE